MIEGRSVSDFVVSAAQRAAEATIEQRNLIHLSLADQKTFAEALLTPGRIAPAMKRAAAAHGRLFGTS